ncbi:alcohol dehydrogenase (NADP+) [Saitozyma sp. JCM 24511]|nr:alcohol dehydrogenase (NADP+) [Saitozyma sp. JCM 24511]
MSPTTHGKGYGISDTNNYTDFSVQSYPLKTPGPHDVTLDIDFCGVCGSDIHTVTGGWGGLNADFVVPGHEIIGKVTHVGEEVTEFKVGQRVGVGAQVFGCLKCERCKGDNENYCAEQVDTYNAKYPDGVLAQGGYSSSIRVHDRWVFTIPEAIKSEDAAPMLCAGLTVYSPLLRNGAGPGKTVGIVGIGGLGHFAIQFAKALGARVVVFSHSPSKKADCLSLGADEFVTTDSEGFEKPFFDKIDYILSCADVETIPLGELASTLKVGGLVTSVGLPDGEWKGLQPQLMASNGSSIGCSHIGSKKEA